MQVRNPRKSLSIVEVRFETDVVSSHRAIFPDCGSPQSVGIGSNSHSAFRDGPVILQFGNFIPSNLTARADAVHPIKRLPLPDSEDSRGDMTPSKASWN